jgi:hypothetical protein
MSSAPAPARVRGWFVTPPPVAPPALTLVAAPPVEAAVEPPIGSVPPIADTGVRVCVVGTLDGAGAFGLAVAQRLARRGRARTVIACHWAPGGRPLRHRAAPASPSARRLAAALVASGHAATANGRVVAVTLPGEPEAAVAVLTALGRGVGAGQTLLVTLVGPRDAAFTALLAEQDLVLAVVPATAAPVLQELLVASLTAAAPNAAVRAVPLPTRFAGPARRAAVARALEALA